MFLRKILGMFIKCMRLLLVIVSPMLLLYCSVALAGNALTSQQQTGLSVTPIRAIDIVSRGVSPEKVKVLIDKAAAKHFNVLILGIAWGGSTKLNSMPWVDTKYAWSRKQLLDVVNYARSRSLEVVPAVPLLTHAKLFFGNSHPGLFYNPETYDPRKPEVYKLVFRVLDEIIDLLHPKAIHIGHDELFGSPYRPKHWYTGEELLPADLFGMDVQRIHDHLSKRGIKTWMWGDMLISHEELPGMYKGSLLGGVPGYGAALRNRLPKDIVICDWHYRGKERQFRSVTVFRRDGFPVLGTTFKDETTIVNFSKYASTHGAKGMIAAPWFYVQRRDWNVVDRIINFSGTTFFKDFPDSP